MIDRKSVGATLMTLALAAVALSGCAHSGSEDTARSRYISASPMEPFGECRTEAPSRQWAVVIGINDYQDEGITDLQGAVNDAWAFYHYLVSPAGGGVPPVRARLLLNEGATREAVVGALGKFLANACPQDQVVIYFAGHGHPEPERPEEAFLLMHDTKLANLVGSAVSMNQLPEFLKWRANSAGSLLLLVDACHSGTIKFPGKRGVAVNQRMKLVSVGIAAAVDKQESKGWGAIAAAASDQLAAEFSGACIFGDHPYVGGLFTCHLLKGLSGQADADRDKRVSLDELFAYLNTNVSRDSGMQQRPQRSGSIKGETTISNVGTASVGIPVLPEKYSGARAHPLRPWIYTGAGLTAAAAAAGVTFSLQSQDTRSRLDEGAIGEEKARLERENNDEVQSALVSYGVAGGLGALTLAALLFDLFSEPEDESDVYRRKPLFELSVSYESGVPGGLFTLNVAW